MIIYVTGDRHFNSISEVMFWLEGRQRASPISCIITNGRNGPEEWVHRRAAASNIHAKVFSAPEGSNATPLDFCDEVVVFATSDPGRGLFNKSVIQMAMIMKKNLTVIFPRTQE